MKNTPEIQTDRLCLRAPSLNDARDVFNYSSNPNVLRYTGGVHYALAKEHWNKGVTTEAVTAVISWAFRQNAGLQRIVTDAMAANRASTRVMEKCWMKFQKHVHEKWPKFEEPVQLAVYSISRDKWEEGGHTAQGSG